MSATAQTTRLHVADLLRAAWPDNTAKRAARAAGLSPRSAEGWVAGRFTPSAATLLRMAEQNDALRRELVRRLTGDADAVMGAVVLPLEGGDGAAAGDGRGREGGGLARARGPVPVT